MKATEATYLVLLRLKIIIGLLKFRIFSNSRKGSIKSGSHFSAKLTKNTVSPSTHKDLC
jgi:Kef-type K+ transport system membrane component KefB